MKTAHGGFGTASVFAISFLCYLSTFSYLYTYDGIVWAMLCENQAQVGAWRFETPHYLAFLGLGEALYFAVFALFPIRAILFFQVFSAFFAATSLALLERLLCEMKFSQLSRVAALIAVGASPTFWKFASTSESYALATALFVGMLWMACREGGRAMKILGILVPVLGHQSLASWGITRIVASRGESRRHAMIDSLIAGIMFLFLAFAAYRVSPGVWKSFGWWLAGLAQSGEHSFLNSEWSNPRDTLKALFVRPPGEFSTMILVGWCSVLTGVAGLHLGRHAHRLVPYLSTFVIIHAAVISCWAPLANDYWVFLLVPLSVGIAFVCERSHRWGAVVIALLLVNATVTFVREVKPALSPENNLHLARARQIRSLSRNEDAILIPARGRTQSDKVYIPYFSGRTPIYADWILAGPGTPDNRLARLEDALRAHASRGRIFVVREMLEDTAVATGFEKDYGIPSSRFRSYITERTVSAGDSLLWLMKID